MNNFFTHHDLLSPPVNRAAYSDRTAWIMAECSRLAYYPFEQDRDSIIGPLQQGGFELCDFFDQGGTQAYLAKRDDLAVLAFRGTQKDYRDILADIKFRMYRNPDGSRIHRGFGAAFSYVMEDAKEAIDRLGPDIPLYFTGHSLGGALATIATAQLANDQVAACYTFGSPRVGNTEFSRMLKIPVYRIVNTTDIVARVPLMVTGYIHVGDLRFLTRDGQLLSSPNLFFTEPGFFFSLVLQSKIPFTDHRIIGYSNKLAQIAVVRNK